MAIFADRKLEKLRSVGVNCHTKDDFPSIWANVFRELERNGNGDELPTPYSPEDVRHALEELDERTLIVIDELDRLEDEEALSLIADTVKTLSDHSVRATLVLVGVADSVDDLIGDHQSIVRALNQLHMPRMSIKELEEIIDKGMAQLSMTTKVEARDRIARLSEGLPQYTHLLALHASQRAIADDRDDIRNVDVDRAIDLAVQKAQHSIRTAYEKATRSTRTDTLFEQALLACALASKGPLGHFAARAVRDPMSRIMGTAVEISKFNRHLNAFSEPARGSVLEKTGEPRSWFYRFTDPLLQPFVILNGLARGSIDEVIVEEMQRASAATATVVPEVKSLF